MVVSPASAASEPEILPPIAESLLTLAPLQLSNRRRSRYEGDNLCVPLEQFATRDQAILIHLYRTLTELLYAISNPATEDAQKWTEVKEWTQRNDLDSVVDEVREFGIASQSRFQDTDETVAKAVHDLRGGALSPLLGRLQLLERLPQTSKELGAIFVLTRDHLKIMRNAVTGMDDPRRNADRKARSHAMSLMINKWHESVVGPTWSERPVKMSVDCRYEGALTECCLESAAVDRIFYNLANNACRHNVGDRLEMTIFPIPEPAGRCLRFVLSNQVSADDAAFLHTLLEHGADSADRGRGQSLIPLFEPAVSSTGSGFGLTVVAEFVAGAFGLRDRAEALRERYVGAVLDGLTFRVWFHWPAADDALPQKLDDYHHPEQSLSEA